MVTPFKSAARQVERLALDEGGATFIEYALVISVVSIGIGFLLPEIGTMINELFLQAASKVDAVATGAQ
jgi:Flp pilus assembly pilin Flp